MIELITSLPWEEQYQGYWVLKRYGKDDHWLGIAKRLPFGVWTALAIGAGWTVYKPGFRTVGNFPSREEAMVAAEENLKSNYSIRILTSKLVNLID